MAKGKKRSSRVADALRNLGCDVEEGNGSVLPDARTLRVQKRLFRSNVSGQQPEENQRQSQPELQQEHVQQHQDLQQEHTQQQEDLQQLSSLQNNPSTHATPIQSGYESPHESYEEDESGTRERKGRGPATFPKQWNTGRRLDVTLNAEGHIVGEQYHEFSTAIGCMAKVGSAFPITCQNWSQIDNRNKEDAWKEVEDNTFLPEEAKPIVYSMLNGDWREWKHRVKNHYKKFKHNQDEMIETLDKRVMVDQFSEAISYWTKPEVQERAHINSINRAQRKFPHRTGRTPFSEVYEEINLTGATATPLEVWLVSRSTKKGVKQDSETANLRDFLMGTIDSTPAEELTIEFKEKLYQDVIRKDKYGRGTCVGKSLYKKTCGSRAESSQILQEREEFRAQLHVLKEEREELNRIKEEMKQEREKEKEEMDSRLKQLEGLISMYGPPSSSRNASCSPNIASQVHEACSTEKNLGILDGPKVKLLGISIPKDTVAEGILVSKDPEAKVGNITLGPNCWKVFVEKVTCPTEKLWRKMGNISTVGQVFRKFAAWPISDVSLDEENES